MFFGLVGKSCSGKNYVGELFKERGFLVLDLDVLCHDLLKKPSVISSVVAAFGKEVLLENQVCRTALSKIIYKDPSKREILESILYPALSCELLEFEKTQSSSSPIFLNGALLRRAKLEELCRAIIFVEAPYEDRLQRALQRDKISAENFAKREAAQTDVDYKSNAYSAPIWVIKNDKDTKVLELIRQINIICDRINSISQRENETNEEK